MTPSQRLKRYSAVSPLFQVQAGARSWRGLVLGVCLALLWADALKAQTTEDAPLRLVRKGQRLDEYRPQARGLAARVNERVAGDLRQGRIGVIPESEQQTQDRMALQELIDRLNRVQIRNEKLAQALADTPEHESAAEGEKTERPAQMDPRAQAVPSRPSAQTPGEHPAPVAEGAGTLGPDILERLAQMGDLADECVNPFGIAEILYASGYLHEAARFYASALKRIDAADPGLENERAWILFQQANCLRYEQPVLASEMYQRLLREHPDSPLRESAQIWLKLAQWYSKEKPVELIQECEQLKVSPAPALEDLGS